MSNPPHTHHTRPFPCPPLPLEPPRHRLSVQSKRTGKAHMYMGGLVGRPPPPLPDSDDTVGTPCDGQWRLGVWDALA